MVVKSNLTSIPEHSVTRDASPIDLVVVLNESTPVSMNVTPIAGNHGNKDGILTPRLARAALRAKIRQEMEANDEDVLVSPIGPKGKKRKSKNRRAGKKVRLVKDGMQKPCNVQNGLKDAGVVSSVSEEQRNVTLEKVDRLVPLNVKFKGVIENVIAGLRLEKSKAKNMKVSGQDGGSNCVVTNENSVSIEVPNCNNVVELDVVKDSNVVKPKRMSFVDVVKGPKVVEEDFKLVYSPPTTLINGEVVVDFTDELVCKNKELYALHLYGYFVGATMSFSDINVNIRKMWKPYGVKEVTMNREGFYFFRFMNEVGMNNVLTKGPWMVDNYPMFVRKWEPGVVVEKIEPSVLPIWIKIHNLPAELWTISGIGKLFSRFGKPIMMDKMTRDKCNSKSGNVGFARVLVEISANDDLPDVVKVKYPDRVDHNGIFVAGNFLNFRVSYQWRPNRCSSCNVFGHLYEDCLCRVVSEEEQLARCLKNSVQKGNVFDRLARSSQVNSNCFYPRHSVFDRIHDNRKPLGYNGYKGNGSGTNKLYARVQPFSNSNDEGVEKSKVNGKQVNVVKEVEGNQDIVNCKAVDVINEVSTELVDDEWDEKSQLWKDQKSEVLEFLEAKKYPSLETVFQWNKKQYDYFYNLCESYGMDPNHEDEDVNSEIGGIAGFMKEDGMDVQSKRGGYDD